MLFSKTLSFHVELHLELAGSGVGGVVSEKRVIDHVTVFGAASLGIIAADRNTRGIAGVDQVVASGDLTGGAPQVLARQLDPEIDVVNHVPFNQDPCTSVDVDAIGILFVAVAGFPFEVML